MYQEVVFYCYVDASRIREKHDGKYSPLYLLY